MFLAFNQQFVADSLKAFLLRIPKPQDRKNALAAIGQFERSMWYPQLFNQAVNEIAPGAFQFDGEKITFAGTSNEARTAILSLLEHYQGLLAANVVPPKTMGTKDAMQYVSDQVAQRGKTLTLWGVKKYINRGELQGTLVGNSLAFDPADLDRFVDWYISADIKRGPKGPHKHAEA